MTTQNEEIFKALNELMAACGYRGESGTEWLFDSLHEAVEDVGEKWHIVEQSHNDGLCYDVNRLLADALEKVVVGAGPQT